MRLAVCLASGIGLAAAGHSTPALAQAAASASVQSDFGYRGVSLSTDRPAASLTLSYDHASGAYVSVAAIAAATEHDGVRLLGHQAYAGVAGKFPSNLAWDLGVADTQVDDYEIPRSRIAYREVYAGLSWRNVSAHTYYSPDYMGDGVRTLYTNLEASWSPAPDWTITGGGGLLVPIDPADDAEIRKTQFDLSLGATRKLGKALVALKWTHHGPHGGYSPVDRGKRNKVIVGITYAF